VSVFYQPDEYFASNALHVFTFSYNVISGGANELAASAPPRFSPSG
jgi:hypothetical protein